MSSKVASLHASAPECWIAIVVVRFWTKKLVEKCCWKSRTNRNTFSLSLSASLSSWVQRLHTETVCIVNIAQGAALLAKKHFTIDHQFWLIANCEDRKGERSGPNEAIWHTDRLDTYSILIKTKLLNFCAPVPISSLVNCFNPVFACTAVFELVSLKSS